MPTTADIEHLLRRTEFVARPERVAALSGLPSIDACVDDVMAVVADPGSANLGGGTDWQRGEQLTYHWFDRMAHDSPRPLQEKMAFFWHGHFCSSLWKIELIGPVHEQIDIFRYDGLKSFPALAKRIATQAAMLRYLDNDLNRKSSPNQNFARELMELFVLGVGNYTEADVESAAAAWTGHSYTFDATTRTNVRYQFNSADHDASLKSFLGATINGGADWQQHGSDTIDVMLGQGVVSGGAARNQGRPTRDVAADFLTRKMWTFFAGTPAPDAVVAALRTVAIQGNFEIRPWLRALLLRPEFYGSDVRNGLVRSPVDLMVAYLVATGQRSAGNVPLWWLDGMGQRPLAPPDVSGWKHNEYFVSAGAMANRCLAARYFMWNTMLGFWDGDGLIHLGRGSISRQQSSAMADQPDQFVDLILSLMGVSASPSSRQVLYEHARSQSWSERNDLIALALLMPEFHVA